MPPARRFGLENSKTRGLLLTAAEQLMREEGYAAVTSRRVAAKAGLKPQLVHYYFRTMDDLFLALIKDRGAKYLERYRAAAQSSQPLHALWQLHNDREGTALMIEFGALANHRKAIRAEIAQYGELMRSLQAEVLERVLARHRVDPNEWPPAAVAVMMTSLSRIIVLEEALGVSGGHAEAMALVERKLQQLEPGTNDGIVRDAARG
jgi:AcrR family transcriptional regulator